MSVENEKYDVLEKIGHGSFGVIRKVRRRVDGMILCRKEISYLKMSQKEREQLHAEFQILSTLRHPNIVGYYHREHLKATQDLHLYMEYCGNGDLGRVIRDLQQRDQYAEESFVWSIFAQLVTALYRCHYGVDPPEVGANVLGLGAPAKPKALTGGVTILHRDLKPENVFLGEDNWVKLGDFGLAKMIQSHDFASTYVGTPFYMSPEICAAEKYTLKSDIWSLGCIIYELCTRDPPFNAKSHYQLVQKIKEGKISPLPAVYSSELFAVIKDCLKVNPDRRPDTAALLNLPVVRLMRKEKEVVEMSKVLKAKEDLLGKQIRELEHKMDSDKASMRHEIDASLRREWEVKARLEIDRQVGDEVARLQRKFELEVQVRVEAELLLQAQKKTVTFSSGSGLVIDDVAAHDLSSSSTSLNKSDYPHSSVGAGSADGEFPSTTDLTELSIESPNTSLNSASGSGGSGGGLLVVNNNNGHGHGGGANTNNTGHGKKAPARTPFGRAQTMFAGTPMDVEMASPSPMAIASLSLSPRRMAAAKVPSSHPGNIFTAAAGAGGSSDDAAARWHTARDSSGAAGASDSESDDEVAIPSPTRMIKSSKNPFASKQRPALLAQKSAPLNRLKAQPPSLPAPSKTAPPQSMAANTDPLRTANSAGALRERCNSPNRRLSKIPSAASLAPADEAAAAGGLTRKPSVSSKKDGEQQQLPPGCISKQKPGVRGRTLVELQQARAGGRPLSAVLGAENNVSPKRAFRDHAAAAAAAGRGTAAAGATSEPAAVWDPERDEMPSPFLVRRKPAVRT